MSKKRIIVIGGGLAGLAAALAIAEKGGNVDIFNTTPVKRSHSVCAQGGINGVVHPDRENDSTEQHYYDTVYGGDFLANQPPVKYMAEDSPAIIKLMARAGVPFNRTPEGFLDFRAFGGAKHKRTAYAGASTGQQLIYGLDEQVRRYEEEGNVRKFEFWEMLRIIKNEQGRTAGIVAINMHTMEIKSFPGDAVIIATGGPGMVFGHGTTNSLTNSGAAVIRTYLAGAKYANAEFVQVHPTTIPGHDKLRL
ncbi:MAG: FAD-binding protein, partial [Planctomycetes bacterium]|nr:FAD-binding protein [Planctomycetota bacterium]